VAVDVQGADKARPYTDKANASFTTVVDEANALGQLYGYKAIPNLFLIEADGTVSFKELGTFNVLEPAKRAIVDQWAATGATSEKGNTEDLDGSHAQANAHFLFGQQLFKRGMTQDALTEWRKGVALEPDNYNIRKQIWAIENPDRFYDGKVDYDWQDEQLAKGL